MNSKASTWFGGAIWAVVRRELRVEARRAGHHWLRAGAAAAVVAACAWWLLDFDGQTGGDGLFRALGKTVLVGLWLLAPWLTADCLASEKREGTLGLLFLTPLRARDIVWGKAFLQSWRAFVLVVATWPVLAVPVMMGGVGVPDVLRMLLLQTGALGLALAAGVAASALAERWWRARVLAIAFTAVATFGYVALHLTSVAVWSWWVSRGTRMPVGLGTMLWHYWTEWWEWQWLSFQSGPRSLRFGGSVGWNGVVQAGVLAAASLGLVWATGRAAAWGLERTWRRGGEGRPESRTMRWLLGTVAPGWARGAKARWLALAPLVWLERRSWTGRVGTVMWAAWAGVFLCAQTVFLKEWEFVADWGWIWRWSLVVGMAVAGAGRLRDGDGGAWELLAVSPISRPRLAAGLWLSILAGFAPAFGIVAIAHVSAAASAWRQSMNWSLWDAVSLLGQSVEAVPPALAVVSVGVAGAMRGRRLLPGVFVALVQVGLGGIVVWWGSLFVFSLAGPEWAPVARVAGFDEWSVPTVVIWISDGFCMVYWTWLAWRAWRRTLARLAKGSGRG